MFGSIPTSQLSKLMRDFHVSSGMVDTPPTQRRAELLALFDARTIEDNEPSDAQKRKVAEWLGVNEEDVTNQTFKTQLWAEVKVEGDSNTRMVPVRIPAQELFATVGDNQNLVENMTKELDFLVTFQGKGLERGSITGTISKNTLAMATTDDPDITSGFQDPLAAARTYNIIGV